MNRALRWVTGLWGRWRKRREETLMRRMRLMATANDAMRLTCMDIEWALYKARLNTKHLAETMLAIAEAVRIANTDAD